MSAPVHPAAFRLSEGLGDFLGFTSDPVYEAAMKARARRSRPGKSQRTGGRPVDASHTPAGRRSGTRWNGRH